MKRREYFLFPDVRHAEEAVEELRAKGVPDSAIHAVAQQGVELGKLPVAGEKQLKDVCCNMEGWLWNGNLVIFGVALAGLLVSLWLASTVGTLIAVTVMLLTFFAGERFTATIPSVHLRDFQDALQHGEILLAVDIPKERLQEIDRTVVSHHPEAVRGGVSWTWPALERG